MSKKFNKSGYLGYNPKDDDSLSALGENCIYAPAPEKSLDNAIIGETIIGHIQTPVDDTPEDSPQEITQSLSVPPTPVEEMIPIVVDDAPQELEADTDAPSDESLDLDHSDVEDTAAPPKWDFVLALQLPSDEYTPVDDTPEDSPQEITQSLSVPPTPVEEMIPIVLDDAPQELEADTDAPSDESLDLDHSDVEDTEAPPKWDLVLALQLPSDEYSPDPEDSDMEGTVAPTEWDSVLALELPSDENIPDSDNSDMEDKKAPTEWDSDLLLKLISDENTSDSGYSEMEEAPPKWDSVLALELPSDENLFMEQSEGEDENYFEKLFEESFHIDDDKMATYATDDEFDFTDGSPHDFEEEEFALEKGEFEQQLLQEDEVYEQENFARFPECDSDTPSGFDPPQDISEGFDPPLDDSTEGKGKVIKKAFKEEVYEQENFARFPECDSIPPDPSGFDPPQDTAAGFEPPLDWTERKTTKKAWKIPKFLKLMKKNKYKSLDEDDEALEHIEGPIEEAMEQTGKEIGDSGISPKKKTFKRRFLKVVKLSKLRKFIRGKTSNS